MPRGKKANKPGAGRPTRKTEAVVEILLDAISRGLHVKTACGLAQIDESTFYKWLADDKDLSSQVNYARSFKVRELHGRIEKDDPKFIIKNLEPTLYRDKIEQEITGKDGGPIKLIVEDLRVDGANGEDKGVVEIMEAGNGETEA